MWRTMARNGIQKLAELNAAEAADSTELRLIQLSRDFPTTLPSKHPS